MSRFIFILFALVIIGSVSEAQTSSYLPLERALMAKFPNLLQKKNRLVYFRNKITDLQKPILSRVLSPYTYHSTRLTHYFDGTVSYSTEHIVLFDVKNSRVVLVENSFPVEFLRLLIGTSFADQRSLVNFVKELQTVLLFGSSCTHNSFVIKDNIISFEEICHGLEIVLVEIETENNTIREFRETNLAQYITTYVK